MHKHRHFILHKPWGCLSQFTTNQKTRKNKRLLGELYNFPEGTMAIGRLDEKSEGLLLLTTDGKVSEQVRSKKVEKEYYIQVDGIITNKALNELEKGVEIGIDGKKYTTLPCKAKRLNPIPVFEEPAKVVREERHGPTSWASITVTEGKFRQVRKMTSAVNHPTLRLIRVRVGNIKIDDLKVGDVKEVSSLF